MPVTKLVVHEISNVFVNILLNSFYALAEKFGKDAVNEKGKCEIIISCGDGFVQFVVEDNGCGIPANNVSQVFTPFFTTKPTGQGNTGLGMSLSYDVIVKEHSGKLEIESVEGQFTRVIVRLPV